MIFVWQNISTSTFKLKKRKKKKIKEKKNGGSKGGVWKEKDALMLNLAFDLAFVQPKCVWFLALSPGDDLTFFMYVKWCDVKFSVFLIFPILNFAFLCIRIRTQPIFFRYLICLASFSTIFVSAHYIVYVFIYLFNFLFNSTIPTHFIC